MRIAHVVTYISADGAFGGPVAVAIAQAEELARRGHTVELLAGWDGVAHVEIPGVTVRLFRAQRLPVGGFSGLFSLALMRHFLSGHRYDVVHVHLARDLITLPVARALQLRRRPFVVQTHGMVRPDRRLKARVFDTLATRVVLRSARTALALTDAEAADLSTVTQGDVRIARITNGIRATTTASAPGSTATPDVLFLARLHPRKRVMAFAEMARDLLSRGMSARFAVVGPDEGDLQALNAFIAAEHLGDALTYEGALPPGHAQKRLARAAVYVLPSFAEVFPMTVLEAMALGVPVVLTSDCGIADAVAEREAAFVTDGSPSELADAVAELLTDAELRDATVRNAALAVREVFSIQAVGDALLRHYASETQRVVWMTNVAAPYRRPVWDALAESTRLTVLLLESQNRFRRGGTNRGSEWAEYDAGLYAVAELLTARVTRGESSYYTALRMGFLSRYRPDAVLLGGWESPAYWQALIWCKLRGVRTVGFYESTLSSQRHRSGPIAAIRRRFFRLVDRVVVPGIAARDAILAMGVDESRVDVGFNAVDVVGIAERTELARSTTGPTRTTGHGFLYLGQLIERKNVRALLKAFAHISAADDFLTVAGVGELESVLKSDVRQLGVASRVRFVGHVPYSDIPGLFAGHCTLALVSTEEVWGLVVNEALAAGLHVVLSRAAGVADSVGTMPGVLLVDTSVASISAGMQASKDAWNGPLDRPPILDMTPHTFARVFAQALRAD